MKRGELLRNLALEKFNKTEAVRHSGIQNGPMNKKRKPLRSIENKTNTDEFKPDYVNLFDKGKWDELNDYLKLDKLDNTQAYETSLKLPGFETLVAHDSTQNNNNSEDSLPKETQLNSLPISLSAQEICFESQTNSENDCLLLPYKKTEKSSQPCLLQETQLSSSPVPLSVPAIHIESSTSYENTCSQKILTQLNMSPIVSTLPKNHSISFTVFDDGELVPEASSWNVPNNALEFNCSSPMEKKSAQPKNTEITKHDTNIRINLFGEDRFSDESIDVLIQPLNNTDFSDPPHVISSKKRRWDRKNFCIFCQTLVTNFTRHIVRWHRFEKEVMDMQNILDEDLKVRKKKRQEITDQLRRRGNFLFNSTRETDIEFLPTKRLPCSSKTKNKASSLAYLTCRYCLGMYSRKTFFRHRKQCSVKPITNKNPNLDHVGLGEYVFGPNPRQSVSKPDGITFIPKVNGASPALKEKILPLLQKDEFCSIVLNDSLILSIGSHFLANHLEQKHKYSCTQKMRDAAQLLNLCRNDPDIKCFADCISPDKFYFVIKQVQELCGLDMESGKVKKVGMPARMAYILHEGAKVMLCKAITDSTLSHHVKEKVKHNIHEFLDLMKIEWSRYISTNAENTRKKNKCIKDKLLPDDDDIRIVSCKIKEYENIFSEKLKADLSNGNCEDLCKITIAHMIVLNRRRANEVARAELEFYLNRSAQEITDDVLAEFSPDQINALGILEVFNVPGKNENNAPILFTQEMKANIDLIISCREPLQIDRTNPLLFARSFTANPFDACKIIRELRQQCNLKKPDHFTSIGLRHHLATKTGIKGDDKYTENVCQFLSHTKPVHLKNYRVPLQAVQRGQIGNHLLKMEGSNNVTNHSANTTSASMSNNGSRELIPSSRLPPANTEVHNDKDYTPSEESYTSDEYQQDSQYKKRKKRNCVSYRRWTDPEITIVLDALGHFITRKKLPGNLICSNLINKNSILAGRSWKQVNALIHNYSTGKTKLPIRYGFLKK